MLSYLDLGMQNFCIRFQIRNQYFWKLLLISLLLYRYKIECFCTSSFLALLYQISFPQNFLESTANMFIFMWLLRSKALALQSNSRKMIKPSANCIADADGKLATNLFYSDVMNMLLVLVLPDCVLTTPDFRSELNVGVVLSLCVAKKPLASLDFVRGIQLQNLLPLVLCECL